MTLPLRKKRPTTRPNSNRPSLTSRTGAAAVALATLFAQAAPATAELEWRASRDSIPPGKTATASGAADHAVSDDQSRSVVVNRGDDRSAEHDPFEDDDRAAQAAQPVTTPSYDPFDADDAGEVMQIASAPQLAEPEMPAAEDTAEVPEVQQVFEEPKVAQEAPAEEPAETEELEAAQDAVEQELNRRKTKPGSSVDMVAPETTADEKYSMEAGSSAKGAVEPPIDDESYHSNIDMGDEGFDLEMEFQADGQRPDLTPEQLEARRQEMLREQIEHQQQCDTMINAVRNDTIRNISLDISLRGEAGLDYPFACTKPNTQFQPRSWNQTTYMWKAAGLCHKPLYFEQVQLERYGHDWGPVLQPFMSGAHFFGSVAILPYKMGLETPQECIYELGNYRPGSCAPYMITQPGFTWRAAALQTGVVTGISAAVP